MGEELGRRRRNLYLLMAFLLMTVRTRPHRSRTRPRIGRRMQARVVRMDQEPAPHARERAAGGPEDRAAYRCSCGYVFEAAVSATVGCPRCGDTQAW